MMILMPDVLLGKKAKGFTLIEVVTALFVFLILMAAISGIFVSAFSGYKNAKAVQRDTENAQYAIGVMTKELRTSSIVSPTSASTVTTVRFYDYSQDICFSYRIQDHNLQTASAIPPNPDALDTADKKLDFCKNASLSSWSTLSTGSVLGSFIVTPSSSTAPVSVGKVTIALQIAEGSKHVTHVQTTVSLRDYDYTGL